MRFVAPGGKEKISTDFCDFQGDIGAVFNAPNPKAEPLGSFPSS